MDYHLSEIIKNYEECREKLQSWPKTRRKIFEVFPIFYKKRANLDWLVFNRYQECGRELQEITLGIEKLKKRHSISGFQLHLSYYLTHLLEGSIINRTVCDFNKVSTSSLREGLKLYGLNIFTMYSKNLLELNTVVAMLKSNYELNNSELNVLTYNLKNSQIYCHIKQLVQSGQLVQPELTDRVKWRDYYNLSYPEQEKLGTHISFENLCNKINLINIFYDQLEKEDQNFVYNVRQHTIGSIRSAYIQANFLDKKDRLHTITEEDIPKLLSQLDDIHNRYLLSLEREVNIEKSIIKTLISTSIDTKTLKAGK